MEEYNKKRFELVKKKCKSPMFAKFLDRLEDKYGDYAYLFLGAGGGAINYITYPSLQQKGNNLSMTYSPVPNSGSRFYNGEVGSQITASAWTLKFKITAQTLNSGARGGLGIVATYASDWVIQDNVNIATGIWVVVNGNNYRYEVVIFRPSGSADRFDTGISWGASKVVTIRQKANNTSYEILFDNVLFNTYDTGSLGSWKYVSSHGDNNAINLSWTYTIEMVS